MIFEQTCFVISAYLIWTSLMRRFQIVVYIWFQDRPLDYWQELALPSFRLSTCHILQRVQSGVSRELNSSFRGGESYLACCEVCAVAICYRTRVCGGSRLIRIWVKPCEEIESVSHVCILRQNSLEQWDRT